MPTSLGIDLGSRMIKAAVVEPRGSQPRTLPLSSLSPFQPYAAIACDQPLFGWDAMTAGPDESSARAVSFRDASLASQSQLQLGQQVVETTVLQRHLLDWLAAQLQANAPAATSIVMTVPDSWIDGGWTLAAALGMPGWKPSACIKESLAVFRSLEEKIPERALLISAGYRGISAARIENGQDVCHSVALGVSHALSGEGLRKNLLSRLAETVIGVCRRDPREDSEADQLLHQAMETALMQLCQNSTAQVTAPIFGQPVNLTLNPSELADCLPKSKANWLSFLGQWLGTDQRTDQQGPEKLPVYLWGELALLLPLTEWLEEEFGSRYPVQLLPLDVVSAGAALVASDFASGNDEAFTKHLAQIGAQDGRWEPVPLGRVDPGMIPLLSSMPPHHGGTEVESLRLSLLEENEDGWTTRFRQQRILLGRNHSADCLLDEDRYPMVSGDHAALYWQDEQLYLEDLGSTNGTYVGEHRLESPHPLQSGDHFRLGLKGPKIELELE